MTRGKWSRAITLLAFLAFLILMVWKPTFSADEIAQKLWEAIAFRVAGSVIFALLIYEFEYRVFAIPKWKHLLILIPAWAVVINNLPILALIWETATVDRMDLIWLFALQSLCIGLFEELVFRGVLFVALLEKRRASTKQIFWVTVVSSALFGLIHLANLLEGAGIVPTLMQVGYSFLIGAMCSIVLLKTGDLLQCILLHSVYNFCGGLLPTLGSGDWWDTPTIIITAVLAVAVSGWMLYILLHVKPKDTDRFYGKKKGNDDEYVEI